MESEHAFTLQVRLTAADAMRLRRIVETSKLAVPDVIRMAMDRMDVLDDEEPAVLLPDEAAAGRTSGHPSKPASSGSSTERL
jgi:hypothetical protein